MSSTQIEDLISPLSPIQTPNQEIEPEDQCVEEKPQEKVEAEAEEIKIDAEAGDILSLPEAPVDDGKSKVLKTRKQLIEKITEICEHRNENVKLLNLKRRRKRSLENILQTQLAEAAQKEMEPEVHPELEKVLPQGMQAKMKFGIDMAFRLDLTLCAILEKGVSFTDAWHGLTADGYARSIEQNETLSSEIKTCWEEILSEPENEWILDSCTASMRLFMCHAYGLMNVLKKKEKEHDNYIPPMPPLRRQTQIFKQASPHVEAPRPTGKLRDLARKRQASRQNDPGKIPLHPRAQELVKSV